MTKGLYLPSLYRMLAIKQILLDLSTTLLAFGMGLMVFRRLERVYRILFFQVLIYLLVDLVASRVIGINNGWLYNILILIETGLLLFAAQTCFNTKQSKWILLTVYGGVLTVFLVDIFHFTGIINFAYHAAIAEGITLTGVYLFLLYIQLMRKIDSSSKAIIIASTGMVLYFAGTVPYLGVMFYVRQVDAALSKDLFEKIVVVLALVRYLFIAIAFFIAGKNK